MIWDWLFGFGGWLWFVLLCGVGVVGVVGVVWLVCGWGCWCGGRCVIVVLSCGLGVVGVVVVVWLVCYGWGRLGVVWVGSWCWVVVWLFVGW